MLAEQIANTSVIQVGRVSELLLGLGLVVALSLFAPPRAMAATNEAVLDAAAMEQLEQQATVAPPREQCALFAELVHDLTEEAGREIAAGQEDQAQATLQHAQNAMGKMQGALRQDAKRIKNAEMLMDHTARRLSDMVHVATSASRDVLQATLQKLNAVHSELLTQVFAR